MRAKAKDTENPNKSKTEMAWELEGDQAIIEWAGLRTEVKRYEPATFMIGSLKYTPDYLHVGRNGEIIFVEVKASKRQRDYAYSMARAKAAAEAFPWFFWMVAVREGKGWNLTWLN